MVSGSSSSSSWIDRAALDFSLGRLESALASQRSLGSHILIIRAVVDDGPAWAIAGRSIRGAALGLSGGVIGVGRVGEWLHSPLRYQRR